MRPPTRTIGSSGIDSVAVSSTVAGETVAYRGEIIEALTAIPTLSVVSEPDDIFSPSGIHWGDNLENRDLEIACSIELIDDCGLVQESLAYDLVGGVLFADHLECEGSGTLHDVFCAIHNAHASARDLVDNLVVADVRTTSWSAAAC